MRTLHLVLAALIALCLWGIVALMQHLGPESQGMAVGVVFGVLALQPGLWWTLAAVRERNAAAPTAPTVTVAMPPRPSAAPPRLTAQTAVRLECVYVDGGRAGTTLLACQVGEVARQCASNPTVAAIFATDSSGCELARWERGGVLAGQWARLGGE